VLLSTTDWPAIEAQAQQNLAADARDAQAWYALGYSLFRQDRNREAADALRSCLDVRDHGQARMLLARIDKGLADERGMTEQQLSHFHVRYDGDAHEAVGREILQGLERHYSTLVSALDHQPQNTIPVILFSRERYYDASGAPAWSGGAYDGMDGRIRVPIGGLTQSLTSDLDKTLLHELTHAFIHDKSRGIAPREIHEGLAQYMEGERIASRLSGDQLAALARGSMGGVGGFYTEALSFVEYLMAARGAGGMNDLLREMGESGSVEQAFQRVHGSSFASVKRSWRQRLEQEYGT
jgi:hypothetical protein